MSEEEITDENYCDWRQSNCPLVKDYRARIAELEAVLKPFAYYAEQIPDDVSDTASASGTVGDLRAALAALKGEKNG
jgi:hypothetical protein